MKLETVPEPTASYPSLLSARIVVTASSLKEDGDWSELLKIMRRYSRDQWLSFLSRAQLLIMEDRVTEPRYQIEFIRSLLSQRLQQKLEAFVRREKDADKMIVVTPDTLGVLQQLAILYGPKDEGLSFESETAFDDFGRAILLASKFLYDGEAESSLDNVIFIVARQSSRVQKDSAWKLIARAMSQFELSADNPSPEVAWFREEFFRIYGVDARRYFLGGLIAYMREASRTLDQIREAWMGVFATNRSIEENALLTDYLRIRAAEAKLIEPVIREFDENDDPRRWTLIALQRYPFYRFPNGACYALHPGTIATSLFDGFYFTILDSYRRNHSGEARQTAIETLARKYGSITANYVENILCKCFGERLIKLPPSNEADRKRCDFVIVYPHKIIIIEVKTSRFTTPRYFGCRNCREVQDLLEKAKIGEATEQLFQTIEDLRNQKIRDNRLISLDWTSTVIIPIIISEENLPMVPFAWDRLYAPYDNKLRQLNSGAGRVGHLRFLLPEDLFYLPDIVTSTELAKELLIWGEDEGQRSNSFNNYLHSRGVNLRCVEGKEIFREACETLKTILGLRESPAKDGTT